MYTKYLVNVLKFTKHLVNVYKFTRYVHCKYIACKKGNFSMSFFPILFQCIKGSENIVKLILE